MLAKTRIIGIALFNIVFLLVIGSAFSATRTISSSNDNIYIMIRNSNGNYWEADSSNIQTAIDDLGSEGGIVWLPGAMRFNISNTIIVKENVILDLGGSALEIPYEGDLTIVELKDGSGIRNGIIDVAGHVGSHTGTSGSSDFHTYTNFTIPHSAIFLNASSYIESALIEDIYLDSIGLGYNNNIRHFFYIYFNDSTNNNFFENPENLIDGYTSNYATGNGTDSILLNDNTYDPISPQGYYGPRNITQVYLRAYVQHTNSSKNITLTPVFADGSLGDVHLLGYRSSPYYTAFAEITNDTNAPSPWTWQDLENLTCYVNISAEPEYNVLVSMIQITVYTDSVPAYHDPTFSGRGYGIHFYAGNTSVPQKISGVKVSRVTLRNFKHAIFIQNERDPGMGEPGAHIDGNYFEDLWINANERSINISRNTDASRDDCSISGNVFNLLEFQTGTGSSWGGQAITWNHMSISGYNNIFKHVSCWDLWNLRTPPNGTLCYENGNQNCTSIIFTNDAENTFMSGRCFLSTYAIDNGINTTILDTGASQLTIPSIIQRG